MINDQWSIHYLFETFQNSSPMWRNRFIVVKRNNYISIDHFNLRMLTKSVSWGNLTRIWCDCCGCSRCTRRTLRLKDNNNNTKVIDYLTRRFSTVNLWVCISTLFRCICCRCSLNERTINAKSKNASTIDQFSWPVSCCLRLFGARMQRHVHYRYCRRRCSSHSYSSSI